MLLLLLVMYLTAPLLFSNAFQGTLYIKFLEQYIPIVDICGVIKPSSVYLHSIHVFPTPESPIIKSLIRISNSVGYIRGDTWLDENTVGDKVGVLPGPAPQGTFSHHPATGRARSTATSVDVY